MALVHSNDILWFWHLEAVQSYLKILIKLKKEKRSVRVQDNRQNCAVEFSKQQTKSVLTKGRGNRGPGVGSETCTG